MKDARRTITIDCPVEYAFAFTINPNNTPKWVDSVVKEETNEQPTKLGTIYRNQGKNGTRAEFEVTAFDSDSMFELTKRGDNTHVRYTFTPLSTDQCQLEYYVWVESDEISERFSEDNIQKILLKLKSVIESRSA